MRLWRTRLFRMKLVLAGGVGYVLCALTLFIALTFMENNGLAHCLGDAGNPAPAPTAQPASGHFDAWHEHHGNATPDGRAVADQV